MQNLTSLRALAALAPVIFVAHVAEEAPGFVAWINSHVTPDVSPSTFWQINTTAFVITVVVSAVAWLDGSGVSGVAMAGWISFLMGANAFVHIGGAMVDRGYVPGLVSAVLLYLPFCALVFWRVKRNGSSTGVLLVSAVVGAFPMLVHGYRILFLGARLF